jgi:cytochrome c oxidase cbb3-type subunit III
MKKLFLTIGTLCTAMLASAQTTASTTSFWDDPLSDPLMPFYAVIFFVFVVVLVTVGVAIYLIRIFSIFVKQAEIERATQLGIPYVRKTPWWEKFWKKINDSVPVEQEREIDLGHNYDGIRELDNHLPPWWKWLFYGTIVWAAVYLLVFHVLGSLPLSAEEYQNEMASAQEQILAAKAAQPQAVIDASTLQFSENADIINSGKAVFVNNNCASCHRVDGGGTAIGPNLTDAYWIHGGDIKDLFRTINEGVIEKGMPAWGRVMSPQDVRDVAFYVMSLQGSNPPNAKQPQGELYTPAEKSVPVDTAKAKEAAL